MIDNFEDIMSKKTDDELLKIITVKANDYEPAALEAAKKEFAKRNVSAEQLVTIKQKIEKDQNISNYKATQPLETGWKVLTFFFPGLIQILFSGTLTASGYDRKAKELVRWTIYGFGFYLGSFIFIAILGAISSAIF